jgi:hypothetical protein
MIALLLKLHRGLFSYLFFSPAERQWKSRKKQSNKYKEVSKASSENRLAFTGVHTHISARAFMCACVEAQHDKKKEQ